MSSSAEGNGHLDTEDRALLVRVAKRFYLDDRSKVQIAREFDISRFKVARLLDASRATGVVRISIDDRGVVDERASKTLTARLGLTRALVVESRDDVDEARVDVGGAAAALLGSTLRRGETLGLGWGRALSATAEAITSLPDLSVVQLTGATEMTRHLSPVEVVRTLSRHAGGSVAPIFAPLVVDSARTADALRRQPDIRRAFDQFDMVTTAVMSIGSWAPPSSQLFASAEPEVRDHLLAAGVVAEIGVTLLNIDGEEVEPEFATRCVAVTSAQLRAVPRVICVAAGRAKANAVRAVARSGLMTELVVDRALCDAIMELDQ